MCLSSKGGKRNSVLRSCWKALKSGEEFPEGIVIKSSRPKAVKPAPGVGGFLSPDEAGSIPLLQEVTIGVKTIGPARTSASSQAW